MEDIINVFEEIIAPTLHLMKLRIRENSIRLRLTRSEVACVAKEGVLESQTDFGNQKFRFVLVAQENSAGLSASFEQNTIRVIAPKTLVSNWAKSEEVGLYGEQTTSTEERLTIALEKDFSCLDRSRAEDDEADAYPHPSLKPKKT